MIIDSLQTVHKSTESLNEITFDLDKIGTQGIVITVLGYVVVFLALLLTFLILASLTKLLLSRQRKRLIDSGKEDCSDCEDLTGELNAAIATALFLYFEEAHDFENTVLTIDKVRRPYSPWSSKIYGLRQNPRNWK